MTQRKLAALAVTIPSLLLGALLVWSVVKSGGNPGNLQVNSELGQVDVTAPDSADFNLQTLDGETIRLSEIAGEGSGNRVVMVDFWSSWCPPCIAEGPDLAAAYEDLSGKDVQFVGVAVWDDPGQIRDFAQRHDVKYPIVVDEDGQAAIEFGVRGLPEKFFINAEGEIVRKYTGPMTRDKLGLVVNEILAQREADASGEPAGDS